MVMIVSYLTLKRTYYYESISSCRKYVMIRNHCTFKAKAKRETTVAPLALMS